MADRKAQVDWMKARLDEWNAEIDKVEARMRQASAEARLRYEEQLREMRAQRDRAE